MENTKMSIENIKIEEVKLNKEALSDLEHLEDALSRCGQAVICGGDTTK